MLVSILLEFLSVTEYMDREKKKKNGKKKQGTEGLPSCEEWLCTITPADVLCTQPSRHSVSGQLVKLISILNN